MNEMLNISRPKKGSGQKDKSLRKPLIPLSYRHAKSSDIPAILVLMEAAILHNMAAFLSPAEIEATRASMGIDRSLIADQTYFIVETSLEGAPVMVGCGGWGRRRTLYGGDETSGRDDRLSNPATDAARIRAMYTHPDWIRRGVGSYLLHLAESAARREGFSRIELGSTIPGEPLYRAAGYKVLRRENHVSSSGAESAIIVMSKSL